MKLRDILKDFYEIESLIEQSVVGLSLYSFLKHFDWCDYLQDPKEEYQIYAGFKYEINDSWNDVDISFLYEDTSCDYSPEDNCFKHKEISDEEFSKSNMSRLLEKALDLELTGWEDVRSKAEDYSWDFPTIFVDEEGEMK